MTIPNSDKAVVSIEKLRDYCLNTEHPRGKHKARVFESSLGITRIHASQLQSLILKGIQSAKCEEGGSDSYGQRFIADIPISFQNRSAVIRTAWIVKTSEGFPRLTTCYLK